MAQREDYYSFVNTIVVDLENRGLIFENCPFYWSSDKLLEIMDESEWDESIWTDWREFREFCFMDISVMDAVVIAISFEFFINYN